MTNMKRALYLLRTGCLVGVITACGDPSLEDAADELPAEALGDEHDLEATDEPEELSDDERLAEAPDEVEVAVTSQALDINMGFLPHNTQRTFTTPGGCRVTVQHGNYLGAAYAKMYVHTRGCLGQPKVTALVNGQLQSALGPAAFAGSGWAQAQINLAPLVGSDIFAAYNGHYTLRFSGIP